MTKKELDELIEAARRLLVTAQPRNAGYYISEDMYHRLELAHERSKS